MKICKEKGHKYVILGTLYFKQEKEETQRYNISL